VSRDLVPLPDPVPTAAWARKSSAACGREKGPSVRPPPPVHRGVHALRRLLAEQTLDLRCLDLPGFRAWLQRHLARWQNDPVFVQRCRIRDLRRAHPRLRVLEEARRQAADADEASPQSAVLRHLEWELRGADSALSGLTAALETATPEKRPAIEEKLNGFRARRQTLEQEQAAAVGSSPQRQALLRLDAELARLRSATGVDQEEARLAALVRRRGQRSGQSGQAFERQALALTRTTLLPEFARGEEALRRLAVLQGVTLGAARTEFDQLVIRRPQGRGRPVRVLAVVEAKRNLNDLAHGFRRRQENLAWLTGDTAGYDPAAYRTRHFRSGQFDREAVHRQAGETFLFAPGSFALFHRDPVTRFFLERLGFISRPGPLWGVSGPALARLGSRVATDEDWDPDSAAYLGELLGWCRALAEPVETPDVLRLYAAPGRGRQVLLVGR
jgi:hypothetical protein